MPPTYVGSLQSSTLCCTDLGCHSSTQMRRTDTGYTSLVSQVPGKPLRWGGCQSCQLLSWHQADPDTVADSIISGLPAVPGMSRLANPAVSFCFLAWTKPIARSRGGVQGDDFSATRSYRGKFKGWSYCQVHSLHVKTCSSSIFARRQTA